VLKEKTVGILGGMGPEATVDLMQRIIRLTPANDDIDHIHCLVDSNPKVPSRIKALIDRNGEDPAPCLAEMAIGLEKAGADILAIACNTAHYYYETIKRSVHIPVINMVTSVLTAVSKDHSTGSRIGILASPAIQITKLYEDIFEPAGLEIIYPDSRNQELLFELIRAVKAGKSDAGIQEKFTQICDSLKGNDVDIAIIACTELSALGSNSSLETVDAAEILAGNIVDVCLAGNLKRV